MLRNSIPRLAALISLSLVLVLLDTARAQGGYDPAVQTQTLMYNEARTVYLGNLARRNNNIPPLRWNRQLTHAARWFSWDSTENRPSGFCGHQDSQGYWPSYRTLAFGYLGFSGAENSFCGYVTPEYSIQGWMKSPGHRANLLNPDSREIGVGYYQRISDGRGYVTQDFGSDSVYAPVIIENEAISTINPNVNLYIYDRLPNKGFAGLSAATQMKVSNYAEFCGTDWEPYNANKAWTLTDEIGWHEVYVRTRDVFNRTLTASDTIYFGANVPLGELGAAQMSTTESEVTLYALDGGTLPQAQFSLGWLADDTDETFHKWWGNGEPVNDAAAWGGTTYRLSPGDGESFAWVYDTAFIKDTPMVAYFRLKVNDNTSSSEVARISVKGGGTEYGPLSLRGTDFTASDQYQEFALNFTFNTNPDDVFLFFNFWRSGDVDLYVDAVSIFSAPQDITSPLTWSVPGNNYRGQGVWVRYTNGSQFSALSTADTAIAIPPGVLSNVRAVGANPINSVNFALNFSKPVTGLDTVAPFDDFALITGPGISGASITNVSGSGKTYTITVDTGDGDGTIRLDIPDTADITDLCGRPLVNLPFTSGETYTVATTSFLSAAANDGWTLESSEYSSHANQRNNSGALLVGDNAKNRQYRSLLYFDTASLPDNATILSANLKIKQGGVLEGTDPFTTHLALLADMAKGFFGKSPLENTDFQAKGAPRPVGSFNEISGELGWYELTMNPANFKYINLNGVTQFRLRFTKDDNNDKGADILSFYSGEDAINPPQLIVEYATP